MPNFMATYTYACAEVAGEQRPSWSPRHDSSASLVLPNLIHTISYVATTEVFLLSDITVLGNPFVCNGPHTYTFVI